MYEIKSLPRQSIGSKNAEIKRGIAIEEKESKKAEQEKHYQNKEKMHNAVLSVKKESIESETKNSNELKNVLDSIKSEISNIELAVPELFDGSKITQSLDKNAKNIEGLLKNLVSNVSKIKLENSELDLSTYVKSLSEILFKNTNSIKFELDKLNQSVSEISLDIEQPIEWVFDVSRDKKGYIESVKALAYYGDEE